MEKPLHEQLRYNATLVVCDELRDLLNYIADEIESTYVALPCDDSGEPYKLCDPCIVGDREGEIAGFDGGHLINVMFWDNYEFEWFYYWKVKRPTYREPDSPERIIHDICEYCKLGSTDSCNAAEFLAKIADRAALIERGA